MTKAFCVAEHTFLLEMPDGHFLWPALGQYSPFVTDVPEHPLFHLSLVDDITVEEKRPLLVDVPKESGMPRVELYDTGDCFYFEMAPLAMAEACGRLLFGKDFKEASLQLLDDSADRALFALNNALMLLFAFSTACLDTLEMHSSVVVNEGKAYMFLGRSGTGKSTHSSLWLKHVPGSRLLNDDNPVIRIGDDGVVRAYGSPWSGKTPCYHNASAPVGAIVRINQAPRNAISRLGVLEAYASVYSSCSGYKPDRTMSDGLHHTLEQIALNIPCYKLDCLPDKEAAELCAGEVKVSIISDNEPETV